MTNREYMIAQLTNPNQLDGGVSYKAMVYNWIRCPYTCDDARSHCYGKIFSAIKREECFKCKEEWLNQEIGGSNDETNNA